MSSGHGKDKKAKQQPLRRRALAFLGAGTLALGFTAAAGGKSDAQSAPTATAESNMAAVGVRTSNERSLSFHNLHTEERLTVTYWRNGQYDEAAISQITNLLRDHRRNELQPVNRDLLDYLHAIRVELQGSYRGNAMVYEVISGYRARETTDALRRGGAAVARDTSQHQLGNALDFRIEGVPLRELRDTAWCMQRGGVGYYPEAHNNFVHVDVGRVRFWPAARTRWRCMG